MSCYIPLLAHDVLTAACSLSERQQMLKYDGKSGGIVPFNALHSFSVLWEGVELVECVPRGGGVIYA